MNISKETQTVDMRQLIKTAKKSWSLLFITFQFFTSFLPFTITSLHHRLIWTKILIQRLIGTSQLLHQHADGSFCGLTIADKLFLIVY